MELKLVAVSTTGWDVRVGVKVDNECGLIPSGKAL